jgi:hypothetical protein
MGVTWGISHGFSSGELDLTARRSAPVVGWDGLPEFVLVSRLRLQGASYATVRLVLTFLAAMDRARDAVALWDRGMRLYADAPWAYSPAEVVNRSITELADGLLRSGVSQRHLADSAAWRRIAEGLVASDFDRPVRRVIEQGEGAAGDLHNDLMSRGPGGSAMFPFLGGPKVGAMWIRMMVSPGRATVSDLRLTPVAVDVQVRRVTENLGVAETTELELELARRPIQEAWMRLAALDGVDAPGDLAGTCAGLDPALWFYGKYGCTHCEGRGYRVPIYQTCSGCRLPEHASQIPPAAHGVSEGRDLQRGVTPRSGDIAYDRSSSDRPLIGLVGCVKTKLDRGAPARDLYISDLFRQRRRAVENRASRWFIISAEYGLVEPDDWIEPYDKSLADLTVTERRDWANGILSSLRAKLGDLNEYTVEIHAGANYFGFGLADGLRVAGANVAIPTEGLRQGEQLSFYKSDGGVLRASATEMPGATRRITAAGTYAAIGEVLDAAQTPEVRLSLDEIEQLIGTPLPPSARKYQAWWYGPKPGAWPWTKRGWKVSPRLGKGYVVFHKPTDAPAKA